MTKLIEIDGRKIGPGEKSYLIAEAAQEFSEAYRSLSEIPDPYRARGNNPRGRFPRAHIPAGQNAL